MLAFALHDPVEDHGAEQDREPGQDGLAHVGVLQGFKHILAKALAPISDATTTMAGLRNMVWLMPARIDGLASGRSTRVDRDHFDAPKEIAASRTFSGRPRKPRTVSRTTGEPPKIIVVTTAAGLPVPKKAMTGIMKTKAGMLCMTFLIGWTTA